MSDDRRLHEMITRHFDNALTPEEERELAQMLDRSAEARRIFRSYARLEGATAHLARAGLFAAPTGVSGETRRPASQGRRRTGPRWTRALLPMAVAASIAVVMLLLWSTRRSPADIVIVSSEGSGSILRAGHTLLATPGTPVFADDDVHTDGSLVMTWNDDGTTVALSGDAQLHLESPIDGKHLRLLSGRIDARIAKQPPGRPMVFSSQAADAEVIGTRLSLSVNHGQTRLAVTEGVVRFGNPHGQVEVSAGMGAVAVDAQTMPALDIDHATTAASPPPAVGGTIRVSNTQDLENAVRAVQAGETIILSAGTYHLQHALLLGYGVPGVTLRGEGTNADVHLSGGGTILACVEVGNAVDITIENLTLENGLQHLILCHGDMGCVNLHCRGVILQNARSNFIRVLGNRQHGSERCLIEDCTFRSTQPLAPDEFVAYIDINGGRDWNIRSCHFEAMNLPPDAGNNTASAILAYGGASGTRCERNRFIDCRRAVSFGIAPFGGTVHDHLGGMVCANMIVRHRGVHGDTGIAINDSPGTEVVGNTVLLSGTYSNAIEGRFVGSTDLAIVNNLCDADIVLRDGAQGRLLTNLTTAQAAWFVDPDHGDLHPTTASLLTIGVGTPWPDDAIDADGRRRDTAGPPLLGASISP